MPVLVLVRRAGCSGGVSVLAVAALPFFAGSEARLRLRSDWKPFTLDVERRGSSASDISEPCIVVSDMMLPEMLLAGEIGAARCAGFLATGGAAFSFASCSCDTAGFGPTGGAGAAIFTGFRFC